MANVIKNSLYPYIEKYINEYLHGFSKEKIDIELTKGEITLEKMSLRPDTINKIMDEKNIPFWIKVGLITKIYIGASAFSVIGEIPLELVIDGVDILLSPSYKWIIKNMEKYSNNNSGAKDTPNPLGNDVFNKKVDDFDLSIFKIEKIQEIFKDKTVISNVVNSLFKSLYSFYSAPNFAVVVKIKNVHIRFEDDELMNYTGDIAYGLRINLIQLKLGFKGNMKKDSIKLESLDVYWENDAKILISSNFLNGCIENGKLQERYFTNLKNVRFERFQYLPSTKFIIQDFNFSINLGTRCENKEDIDIFDVKTYPSMVYFQLASNELNINLYTELLKILNNFKRFMGKFPIIEKVQDYHPYIKPSEQNSMNYINIVENYRKNVLDSNNKHKMLVRDWINYFYWFQKSKKGEKVKVKNPVRTEFVRFYKICMQKVDIHEIEKEKEKKEKEQKEKEQKEKEKEKEEEMPIDSNEEKGKEAPTPGATPTPGETPTPEETPEGNKEEQIQLIPDELEFSSRIDLLIKGFNINLHSPLSEKRNDYISFAINGIEIKIKLSKDNFDLNFKVKTIDLGPSNLTIGQRVIIQPKSYRKAIPEQNSSLNATNYFSVQNTRSGTNSRIANLINKYNPNHEEKIKVIDEALELAGSHSRLLSIAPSENGEYRYRSPLKINGRTPLGNTMQNLGQTISNMNMTTVGKSYANVFIPRPTTFAKSLIDNNSTEGNTLQDKKYEKKKNNEINISQAINDYNSYKNQERIKIRASRSPPTSLSSSCQFNLRESEFGIKPNVIRAKDTPLNLLEIFSNTEVGALSIKYTKYNNPVTLDSFSIQIGTIRLNMFVNYLLDILRILSEYKKATKVPKIATTEGTFAPSGLKILEIQEYFYNYLLKKIPDYEKTDSMNEYMEYLRKEIISKKKFSSKPEHFALNQIFSFFPKGFDFHFDYENIEIVAYDKNNVVSSKIIVPSNELVLNLTFTKIFVKLLDLEIEITDLNKCETIIEQLKDLAKDKFKVVQIVLEPCYKQIKDGIEPLLSDENIDYTKNLHEQENNLLRGQPMASYGNELERQNNLKKEEEEKRRIQQQMLLQRQKEERELLYKQQQERLRLQRENEERQKQIQLQKQKEELLKRQQLEQQERERQKQLEKQRLQNKIPQPKQKFQNQISSQQHIAKNQIPKYTNIASNKVNSSSNSSNKVNYLINQKIPNDNIGNIKGFSNVKKTKINNNILPKMQRQIAGSYEGPVDKESYSIQGGSHGSIRYNTGENINQLNNFNYSNYANNTGSNVNNIKLYYNTEAPQSYLMKGSMNNSPISGNNSNYI